MMPHLPNYSLRFPSGFAEIGPVCVVKSRNLGGEPVCWFKQVPGDYMMDMYVRRIMSDYGIYMSN